jgi:chromosome segregation ATPase
VLARAAEYEAALEDLSRQHDAAAGRLELAQRQAVDYRARMDELEAELEQARREEAAYEAFAAAVRSRDAAALETVAAVDAALDSFAELVRLQEAAEAAREAVSPRHAVAGLREPEELAGAWQRLLGFVRSRIDEQLLDEAVEAAARSSPGRASHEIGKLPDHLQGVARLRRQQLETNGTTASKDVERAV